MFYAYCRNPCHRSRTGWIQTTNNETHTPTMRLPSKTFEWTKIVVNTIYIYSTIPNKKKKNTYKKIRSVHVHANIFVWKKRLFDCCECVYICACVRFAWMWVCLIWRKKSRRRWNVNPKFINSIILLLLLLRKKKATTSTQMGWFATFSQTNSTPENRKVKSIH